MSNTNSMKATCGSGGQAKSENSTGTECGSARSTADIQPEMIVMSSCGCTMGKVDHLEGDAIKLTRKDSLDGQHHYVPTSWVDHVDTHVHLKKNAEDTRNGWKADAASCASMRA